MELGIKLAVGDDYRTVAYVEREAFPASILVARMEDEAMDRAPIADDLSTFDGVPYRGLVDLVIAGLPCQPYSLAGSQKGHADERALWPQFVRIVRECEPGAVFIENVPAFRKHFEPVWRHLRELGFVWAPPLLSTASESGAPHIRERFFALAAHPERIELRVESWRLGGSGRTDQARPGKSGSSDSDTDRSGLEGRGLPECERSDERSTGPMGDPFTDSNGGGLNRQWCGWVFDGARETLRHDADRCGDGCRIRGTLWDAESPPVRVATRSPGYVDRLRAIGNVGTPPVVYARAFLTLAERLKEVNR